MAYAIAFVLFHLVCLAGIEPATSRLGVAWHTKTFHFLFLLILSLLHSPVNNSRKYGYVLNCVILCYLMLYYTHKLGKKSLKVGENYQNRIQKMLDIF